MTEATYTRLLVSTALGWGLGIIALAVALVLDVGLTAIWVAVLVFVPLSFFAERRAVARLADPSAPHGGTRRGRDAVA